MSEAPQDQRARPKAEPRDQSPLRGQRRRRAGHHDDRDRLFRPVRREVQPVDDEEAEAGERRRLGMAGNDPGDDPAADARVVPFQPLHLGARWRR